MNDAYSFQCSLLGDILFTSDCTIKIGITVAGPVTYEWTNSIRQGTWFANAYVFWKYLINQWNLFMLTGAMSVSIDLDPDSANYCKVIITPDSSFGVLSSTYFDVPGIYSDVGLSSTPYSMGAATTATSVGTLPYVLTPCWPPTAYSRSTNNLTGDVKSAHDGTVYSTSGANQETVTLGLALDRRSQRFDEVTDFVQLWRERWCRGRSVTFYMDRGQIPTVDQQTIGSGDVLVLPEAQSKIDFTRVIPYKEFQDKMAEVTFGVRTPTPATAEGQSYYILEAL